MSPLFLSENALIGIAFQDSGLVLFGLLLSCFGAIVALCVLLRSNPALSWILRSLLIIALLLFLGIISIDLFIARPFFAMGEYADLSSMFASHRVLIIQLPIVLLLSAIVSLFVYGEKISEKHACVYRQTLFVSIGASLLSVLLLAIESLF